MRAVIKGALAAALLAGTSLAGTAPAEARDHSGTAIAAGLIGLGIGAAIVASDHHDRNYGNADYGYDGGYEAPVNYYAQPAYGYGYGVSYDRAYYGRGYRDGGYDRHDRRWNDRDDRGRDDRGGWDRHDRDRGNDRGNWDHDRR